MKSVYKTIFAITVFALVTGLYIFNRLDYFTNFFHGITFFPFLTCLTIVSVVFFILHRIFLRHKLEIQLRPIFAGLVVFFLFLVIGFSFLVNWRIGIYNGEPVFLPGVESYPLYKSLFGLAINFLIRILWIFVVFLAVSGIGSKLLSVFSKNRFEIKLLERTVIGFAIGCAVIIFSLFVLSYFRILTSVSAGIVLFLCLVFSIENVFQIIKGFFVKIVILRTDIVLLTFLLSFIAVNCLELLTPIPFGWDDLTRYQNYAKLIAETGIIPVNGIPVVGEIFMSLGYLIPGQFTDFAASFSLFLSALTGIIAVFGFYLILKRVLAGNLALRLTTVFYVMPVLVFLSQQAKIDLLLMDIIFAGILLCFYLYETGEKSLLFLISFLFGFAFILKYTTFFILLPFAFFVLLLRFHGKLKLTFSIITISLILFALPSTFWFSKNLTSYGRINSIYDLKNSFYGKTEMPDTANLFSKLREDSLIPEGNPVSDNSVKNEKKSYIPISYNTLIKQKIGEIGTDIGFVWFSLILGLASFIPLILQKKEAKILFAIGSIYWLAWLFLGSGIIYYALPGFVFVAGLVGAQILHAQNLRPLNLFISIIFILYFALSGTMRFREFYTSRDILLYATGALTGEETVNRILPDFVSISKEINDNKGLVYKVGNQIDYFIKDSTTRLYDDSPLSVLNFLYKEKDKELTVRRLKTMGFKYLLLSKKLFITDKDHRERYRNAFDFIDQNKSLEYKIVNKGLVFAEIK